VSNILHSSDSTNGDSKHGKCSKLSSIPRATYCQLMSKCIPPIHPYSPFPCTNYG
jgi:hypothetical protein